MLCKDSEKNNKKKRKPFPVGKPSANQNAKIRNKKIELLFEIRVRTTLNKEVVLLQFP